MVQAHNSEYDEIDEWIGRILLAGLLISILVMAVGLAVAAVRGGNTASVLPLNRVLPELAKGSAPAILDTGILLLFATPLAGVLAALIGFAVRRNRTFVAVTASLLLLLVLGFVVALH